MRPLHWEFAGLNLGPGVIVGAFDGYPNYRNDGWSIAPLPALSIEAKQFGANVSVIPAIRNRLDGAISIQFELRVW